MAITKRPTDPHSGRLIADGAKPALEKFRAAGGRPFHEFTPEQLRQHYITGTATAGLPPRADIQHIDYELASCTVRVYTPPKTSEQHDGLGVLYVHGGGWVMGGIETHHTVCQHLAKQVGAPVALVDYRLAPEHRFPAAYHDTLAALQWFVNERTAHEHHIESVAVVGDSAGGQLAASVVNQAVLQGEDRISSQVLLYPVTSAETSHLEASPSYERIQTGFPLVADTMRWFIDLYISDDEDRSDARLSPLVANLSEKLPPTFILTVDNDPLADDGALYARKLSTAGVAVRYEHLAGYAHGLFTSAGVIPAGARYLEKVAEYILEHYELGAHDGTR